MSRGYDFDGAEAVFEALADATPRQVVCRLAEGGPATATELGGRCRWRR